ncbi:hypothetical protein BDB01DRAFT_909109 [Pilobolus umbonatus]|nr:hypothetical protein BDB01DRAFT_909109 [Pilobolus umbonatus]
MKLISYLTISVVSLTVSVIAREIPRSAMTECRAYCGETPTSIENSICACPDPKIPSKKLDNPAVGRPLKSMVNKNRKKKEKKIKKIKKNKKNKKKKKSKKSKKSKKNKKDGKTPKAPKEPEPVPEPEPEPEPEPIEDNEMPDLTSDNALPNIDETAELD